MLEETTMAADKINVFSGGVDGESVVYIKIWYIIEVPDEGHGQIFCQAFFLVICNPKFRNGSLEAKVGDAPAGVHIHKVGGRADVAEEVIVAENVDHGIIIRQYLVLLQISLLVHHVER